MADLTRRLVPSMFHRRLLLLSAVMAVVAVALLAQLTRLTLVEGEQWRARAESVLVRRQVIPTSRGRIVDRKGRVLAVDEAAYSLGVAFPVLTGQWAYEQARAEAYRRHREGWGELTAERKHALTLEVLPEFEAQVAALWRWTCDATGTDSGALQRRVAAITSRVNRMAGSVWSRRKAARSEELDAAIGLVEVAQPILEQTEHHVVVEDLPPRARIEAQRMVARAAADPALAVWRQVELTPSRRRVYPNETMTVVLDRRTFPGPLKEPGRGGDADGSASGGEPWQVRRTVGGVGLHLIGTLRPVWEEDLAARPYRVIRSGVPSIDAGGYRDGDKIGSWGVERSMESVLRGDRGQVLRRIDTGREQRIEPVAGRDVALTIDVALQARVQAAMDPALGLMKVQPWHGHKPADDPLVPQLGEALHGAAVVLQVSTGQLLAAVSTPGFTAAQLREDPDSVWEDRVNRPYFNRAVAQPYQPGSTIKPLVLATAVTEHRLRVGEQITCNGYLDPDAPQRYRCWIYKSYHSTHGPLAGPEAIARSCNVFFYTMGRRLGPKRLVKWYGRFGLGRPTGTGLIEEAAGDLPELSAAGRWKGPALVESDGIFMAIGQGPVRWTPVQAANAYAAIARGGRALPVTLVLEPRPGEGRGGGSGAAGVDLGLDPAGVRLAMQGLYEAANERYGTAHHLPMLHGERTFNIEGVRIYGKSGTAEGVPYWEDVDRDGRFTPDRDRLIRRGDHAWVICMVQKPGSDRPDYVVAVVVEFGGSGGSVAGPVANQVLQALRAEGYL